MTLDFLAKNKSNESKQKRILYLQLSGTRKFEYNNDKTYARISIE